VAAGDAVAPAGMRRCQAARLVGHVPRARVAAAAAAAAGIALAATVGLVRPARADTRTPPPPEDVVLKSGALRLHALLYRPAGRGPFPAVLFNHGSARPTSTDAGRRDAANRERQAAALGPVFARHGYVLLFLFRRGDGRSAGEGTASGEVMERERIAHGPEGRNRIQLQLLETEELDDAMAGLAFLRARPEVEPGRLAVVGHSFGGSLALLLAERDPGVGAVVVFAGAANSWAGSPPLRDRLLAAARAIAAPVFFVYAANDYSVEPARVLGAERARLGRPQRVRIYPPTGETADDGHAFVWTSVPAWEEDVSAFLEESLAR